MSNISPRKRKLCDFSEKTVTILVGPLLKSFTIHPTMLINHSRYFRAMLSAHTFKESYEKVARLREIDAGIFQVYITYVYSGNIVLSKHDGGEEYGKDNDSGGVMRFQTLVQLYSLANYLQDINLKNNIIDYLMGPNELLTTGATATAITLAFETNVGNSSALCRLLVDTYLFSCNPKFLQESWKDLPWALHRQSLPWMGSSFLGQDHGVRTPVRGRSLQAP
ncbi:hypothetical protein CBER1_07947 [Cercospora berteroae]|uniref:BTB domain-containing protein n=1 Tax=Cercospora berteroae TaxID=357750 RepID=A0A2S6CC70_9PEZI|nr:hypothetical protein CBER1_07947 [Cercospora berteroae]